MPGNMPGSDWRGRGYVLRRVNYGEADRILDVITPQGKMTVIAKGVRKSQSKLAGGIEIFSLIDLNVHWGKSEFGVVTGARMVKYDGEILKDFDRMELAGRILKKIDRVAESADNAEFFQIVDQALDGLNDGAEISLVESWFSLNLLRIIGEEINLYRDVNGQVLVATERYNWDVAQKAFTPNEQGAYGENEIKMLRLLYTAALKVVRRVKMDAELERKILDFTKIQSE